VLPALLLGARVSSTDHDLTGPDEAERAAAAACKLLRDDGATLGDIEPLILFGPPRGSL
jgi:hypothetical protein